jgi:hypothetical protein
MTPTPDALALFQQVLAQLIADGDEPKPGDRGFDFAKWHRVWIDCVALARTLREGQQLGDQARSIAPAATWTPG